MRLGQDCYLTDKLLGGIKVGFVEGQASSAAKDD